MEGILNLYIKFALFTLGLSAFLGATAGAVNALETESQFIDRVILMPRNSAIQGDAVVALREWYGIPPLVTLTVVGAETACGNRDPKVGGRLVGYHNYGCIRAGKPDTPWARLASGTVMVGGKKWWAWPTMWTGMAALGRCLKTGPASKPGTYLKYIQTQDWPALTSLWYGATVPGYAAYHKNWMKIYNSFKKKANDAGWRW